MIFSHSQLFGCFHNVSNRTEGNDLKSWILHDILHVYANLFILPLERINGGCALGFFGYLIRNLPSKRVVTVISGNTLFIKNDRFISGIFLP